MIKEIREVDREKKILQVTTVDERWYIKPTIDLKTGLPSYQYVPSVTWICEHYPKGIGFYKWLANKGWDEAEALKEAAADKGSKVHQAIKALLEGQTIKINSKFVDSEIDTEEQKKEEALTLEEYECIISFSTWFKENRPKVLRHEFVVFEDTLSYAGTIDLEAEIEGIPYIIDYKTSQSIWPSHKLQVSAYKHALGEQYKLAILQLGYRRNKKKHLFTEIEDKFPEFLAARVIWANETEGIEPKQRDYPLEIKLT